MAKITIPIVKYRCQNCGAFAQVVGTEPMTCNACGIVVCDKCSQKSFCGACLSFLSPDEHHQFQRTRLKTGANFFSGFCGIVGGSAGVLVAFIYGLAGEYLIMGIGFAVLLASVLTWYLLEKKRKNDFAQYGRELQAFVDLINSRKPPPVSNILSSLIPDKVDI
ncbi:MAG: hypothetical protein ACFFDW_07305 [Candidatus Thorarchaeota archaeon]